MQVTFTLRYEDGVCRSCPWRKGTKDPEWGMVLGKGWRREVLGTIRNRKTMWLEHSEQERARLQMETRGSRSRVRWGRAEVKNPEFKPTYNRKLAKDFVQESDCLT